jgi:arylsulfatase A-like enzyme
LPSPALPGSPEHDHRLPRRGRTRARVFPLRLVGLAALLAVGACGPSHRDFKSALPLSDFVAHQQQSLSTELIWPAAGIGLDAVGSGWRRGRDREGEPLVEMPRQWGRLRLFSPEGDLAWIEMELAVSRGAGPEPVRVQVHLNRQPLAELDVSVPWSTYRIEVPAGRARPGLNALDLSDPKRKREKRSIRLRRVRVSSRSGRPVWPQRPDRIRTVGSEAEGGSVVEMPTASSLDVVLRVPEGAYLRGDWSLEPAPGEDFAFASVSIRLLDEDGEERELLRERVEGAVTGRAVGVDLAGWSGEIVRLRWGVTGPGNALVRWHETQILSTEPVLEPPALPVARVAPGRSGRLGQPDVIVILLDAARADAFSPFGGPHETPAVARLAAHGTVFRRAITGSSWTLQSVTSMLTGLYADALGVWAWRDPLPAEAPSLPELMRAAGYETFLFSQHPFYRYDDSYRRGFDREMTLRGDDTETLPAGRLLSPDQPTFALVHLLPPHIPYTPPEPFRGRYTSDYTGEMTVEPDRLRALDPTSAAPPTDGDVRYVLDRYLENVAYADHLVARVLGILDHHERFDEALVVLASDHGEAFMEHGRFVHSLDLHREVLHVPLVVKWPRSVEGFRAEVDEPVSLLDLVPTFVDGLSLSGGEDGFQGRTLLPLVFDGQSGPRSFYAVTRGEGSPNREAVPRVMLESEGWRVHLAPLTDRTQLYDAEADPGETRDLAPAQPLRALLLRQSLLIQSARNRELLGTKEPDRPGRDLDPEEIEQLEALGYLN